MCLLMLVSRFSETISYCFPESTAGPMPAAFHCQRLVASAKSSLDSLGKGACPARLKEHLGCKPFRRTVVPRFHTNCDALAIELHPHGLSLQRRHINDHLDRIAR